MSHTEQDMPRAVPIQINANPTMDFMIEVLRMVVMSVFPPEIRQERLKSLTDRLVANVDENINRMKENPHLMSARLDGSLDRMQAELNGHLQMLANVFNGAEIYQLEDEKASQGDIEPAESKAPGKLIITE